MKTMQSMWQFKIVTLLMLVAVLTSVLPQVYAEDSELCPDEMYNISEIELYESEESIYLTDDNFRHEETEQIAPISSWDFDKSGGEVVYSNLNGVRLNDKSKLAPVKASKKLNRRTKGKVTMETAFILSYRKEGFNIGLTYGGETVAEIRSGIKSIYLYTNSGAITELGVYNTTASANERIGILMEVDIDNNAVTVSINGKTSVIANADVSGVDGVCFGTTSSAVIQTDVNFVKVYADYSINQRFLSAGAVGSLPKNWDCTGQAEIVSSDNSSNPDIYSLSIGNSTTVSTTFAKLDTYSKSYEFSFLASEGTANMLFLDDEEQIYNFSCSNGIFYLNEESISSLSAGIWYNVSVREYGELAEIWLNGKLIKNIYCKSAEINKFKIINGNSASLVIDDILVYTPAAQNVPDTNKAVSEEYDAGIMRCDIWREGSHVGWDYILPYADNHPYLGFYDDGNEAVANWEIKWLAEHGINWQMHCWFLPSPYDGGAIKTPRAQALENGYFYADNSEAIDFAIMWENSTNNNITADIFKNDIVPYWVEHYLKDARYYQINGNAVISIYSPKVFLEAIRSDCQSDEEALLLAQECIDYLRQQCIALGYQGACILGCNTALDEIVLEKSIGFDAVHTYTWRDISNNPETQKGYLQRAVSNTKTAEMGLIPVASVGLDETPWGRASGQMLSAENFKQVLEYIDSDTENYYSNGEKTVVLLDNWNEFGEGHYIMPSGKCGFDYLDAIREVFSTEEVHQDVIPDEKEKAHLGTLYPRERKPKPIEKINVPVGTEVAASWSGQEIYDTWIINKQVIQTECNNGIYKAVSGGEDPAILSPKGLNIDLKNINYIKIRMKRTATDSKVNVYYRRTQDANYEESRMIYSNAGKSGQWEEIYIPVWQDENFCGTLYQLRLDCINSKGEFEIEKIELLRGQASDRPYWYVQGNLINTNTPIQKYDSELYAEMNDIADCFGVNVSYLSDTNEVVFVTDVDVIRFDENGDVYRNGEQICNYGELKGAAESYLIPLRSVAEAFYNEYEYNQQTATISMNARKFFPEISYNTNKDIDADGKWIYRNMVTDSDCEYIDSFWGGTEGGIGISQSVSHSGDTSVYKYYTKRYQRLGFKAQLEPYSDYHFSGWLKNENVDDNNKSMSFAAKYQVWDNNNNLKTHNSGCEFLFQQSNASFALTSDWNYIESNIAANKYNDIDGSSYYLGESDYLNDVYFYITQTAATEKRVYMDDVSLRKIPPFNVFTKSITGGINGKFTTGEPIVFCFSHDVDKWSVTPDKVLLNGAVSENGVDVVIHTDEISRETTVSVSLSQTVIGESYTISLPQIKDAWGRKIVGSTSVTVTAEKPDVSAIITDESDEPVNVIKKGRIKGVVEIDERLLEQYETAYGFVAIKDAGNKLIKVKSNILSSNKTSFEFDENIENDADKIEFYIWSAELKPLCEMHVFNQNGFYSFN
ncbi:MAG: glycoside hydrolase family 99-like domain-containing protein [Clostridia bacterium]|nr:glycoside hydrolase family 99-like domain-containing protein [Clostridia bacterium]